MKLFKFIKWWVSQLDVLTTMVASLGIWTVACLGSAIIISPAIIFPIFMKGIVTIIFAAAFWYACIVVRNKYRKYNRIMDAEAERIIDRLKGQQ